MEKLGQEQIDSVLLEGGGTLNWAALESGVVQQVQAYIAPKLFGGQEAKTPVEGAGVPVPSAAFRLKNSSLTHLGEDILIESEVSIHVHWNYRRSRSHKADHAWAAFGSAEHSGTDCSGKHKKIDSIAVNGICLTVTRLFADSFSADVMHETLNRSSLAGLMVGSKVNLERAMAADGRFGGHIVAGHVDGTGCILRIEKKRRQCGLVYHPCGTESFALCRGKRLHRGRWYKPDGGRKSVRMRFQCPPSLTPSAVQICVKSTKTMW